MSVIDVIKSCYDSLDQISEHIEDAIIYIDDGCAESFQFIGAYPLLVEHGVRAVCSLENLSPLDAVANWNVSSDPTRKLVIMTSRLLSDAHRYILRCLGTYQGIKQCSIFTSISEAAHSIYPDSPLGPDAFREYESLLLQDYEEVVNKSNNDSSPLPERKGTRDLPGEEEGWSKLNEEAMSDPLSSPVAGVIYGDDASYLESTENKLIISVNHFPMIICPLSPKTFVMPSRGSVAEAFLSAKNDDSLSPGLPPLSMGVHSDVEDIPGAILTAHFLHHVASKVDLKLEIFSFGDLSKTVGRILTDLSSLYDVGRRKRSAGLLLVDRTLDLLTPCCHGDSFFDRLFSALPRRENSTSLISRKGLHSQSKPTSTHIQHDSLDVQIPLGDIIIQEDSRSNKSRLAIEAFLCGWNAQCFHPKIQDLVKLGFEVNDQITFDRAKEILSGSLVSSEHFRGTPFLEAVLDRRMKDGVVLVKKWLLETLKKENITTGVRVRPGSATKPELEGLLKSLVVKSDSSLLRNKGIAQMAAATLISLDELQAAKWDAFISMEKMLSISAEDTSQNLAAQLGNLINKSILTLSQNGAKSDSVSHGLLSFQDALLLTCIGYMLAGENFPTSGSFGPFSWQEEHSLKEAIVDAILENLEVSKLKFVDDLNEVLKTYRSKIGSKDAKEEKPEKEFSLDDLDDDQWGKWGDEEDDDIDGKGDKEEAYDDMQIKLEVRDRVDNLFRFLHKLSSLKTKNIPLREASHVLEGGLIGDSYERKGLLYKILTAVLAKHDVPCLEHHSSAVGRLFKSGFGRFGLGQAKPNLADQNVIFVFVVGGINGQEVREAFEALAESGRPDIELIVGGTTLLTPGDMYELLLGDAGFEDVEDKSNSRAADLPVTSQKGLQIFTFKQLHYATGGFSKSNLIGHGAFGLVYRGVLSNGRKVAVKLMDQGGNQGEEEFEVEIELLSRLRSPFLLGLIGYCSDSTHKLLVYEFMVNGGLQEHLYPVTGANPNPLRLDWETRLRIALDAAKGLEYLHEHVSPSIIHRDFKSSNILLDKNFHAKVSDFGLAKMGPEKAGGHVFTRVLGTQGYVAPEYAVTGHLTTKSDVYSYGVVLLELLTGRVPVDMKRPPGESNLVAWALPKLTDREKVVEIMDPALEGQYSMKEVIRVAAIAAMCVQPEADYRPLVSDVVQSLIPLAKHGKYSSNSSRSGSKVGSWSSFNTAAKSPTSP